MHIILSLFFTQGGGFNINPESLALTFRVYIAFSYFLFHIRVSVIRRRYQSLFYRTGDGPANEIELAAGLIVGT
jgi:hypothetical protein